MTDHRDSVQLAYTDAPVAPELELTVYGHPAPQGSKKTVRPGVMVESSKHVRPWRRAVAAVAKTVMHGQQPLDGPLVARMVFTLAAPAQPPAHAKGWRDLWRLAGRPTGYPDASKLARSTEDALKTAGAIADDARIVEYERLAKVYPGRDPEALDRPGARITIRPLATAPPEPLHEWRCPNCRAVTRARMADHQETQTR